MKLSEPQKVHRRVVFIDFANFDLSVTLKGMKSWHSHDEIQASLDEILGILPRMKSSPPENNLSQDRFHRESDFIRFCGFIPRRRI